MSDGGPIVETVVSWGSAEPTACDICGVVGCVPINHDRIETAAQARRLSAAVVDQPSLTGRRAELLAEWILRAATAPTGASARWTRERADALLRDLWNALEPRGWHPALTGSVLYGVEVSRERLLEGPKADAARTRLRYELLARRVGFLADKSSGGFVPWPDDQPPRYNACTDACDMWTGPCACGAWHHDGR